MLNDDVDGCILLIEHFKLYEAFLRTSQMNAMVFNKTNILGKVLSEITITPELTKAAASIYKAHLNMGDVFFEEWIWCCNMRKYFPKIFDLNYLIDHSNVDFPGELFGDRANPILK